MGGRIESRYFLRALYRDQGKLGSWYDSNVTAYDPFPWSPEQRTGDPILNGILAPTTSAMVDFVTRQVGWKVDAHYEPLNPAGERALGEALVHLDRERPRTCARRWPTIRRCGP